MHVKYASILHDLILPKYLNVVIYKYAHLYISNIQAVKRAFFVCNIVP